jgi:hypothetical protein
VRHTPENYEFPVVTEVVRGPALRQFHVLDLEGNQITFGQTFE